VAQQTEAGAAVEDLGGWTRRPLFPVRILVGCLESRPRRPPSAASGRAIPPADRWWPPSSIVDFGDRPSILGLSMLSPTSTRRVENPALGPSQSRRPAHLLVIMKFDTTSLTTSMELVRSTREQLRPGRSASSGGRVLVGAAAGAVDFRTT
jgi:hypothetical protein